MLKRFVGLCLALLCATGCYQVVPLSLSATPVRGATVLVDLNSRGSDSLARLIGPGIASLRGDVLSVDSVKMTVAMLMVTDRRDIDSYWTREPLVVQRSFMDRLQERRFSKAKSIIMGVGLTTGLFILTDAMTGFAGVFGSGGRPSNPSGG